ncbi:hypothetical protein SBRCBS47491_004763 [Sporothrix bragantina]|uniref:AB hydrolase-1 domain-containing protein n=1 Tax=Sporothrix bragantina TaxID=671064 RepID=A0ABP0BSW8_9PEZI
MASTSFSPSTFALPDGRRLRYTLTFPDEPERRTVVLSSLLATTAAVWDDVVEVLHQNGFRALTYDHPGHGGSSAPADLQRNTFQGMADDVFALLQSLSLSKVYAWIGCSLGAATGVVFAARHPGVLDRMVVCDTISGSPGNLGAPDAFTPRIKALRDGQATMEEGLAQTRERWLGKEFLDRHPEKAAWLAQLMSETTLDGFEACIAALLSPGFDLREIEPGIGVDKLLVVVGEKDADLPTTMEALADQIRDGDKRVVDFRVIKNAGHASFIDGFDSWCEVVVKFLLEFKAQRGHLLSHIKHRGAGRP